jgi:hypothetical protein
MAFLILAKRVKQLTHMAAESRRMRWRFFIKKYEMVLEDVSAYEHIGEGTVRCCYRIPDQPFCLKFYADSFTRDPAHPRTFKTRIRLALTRHLFWLNINMQEWRYYERLKKRLPAELMAVFPEQIEPVYSPQLGWGLRETLLKNYDGSYVRLAEKEMRRLAGTPLAESLYRDIELFFQKAVEHAIALYDPRNLLVQWDTPSTFRLRFVDFEPKAKAVIPGLTYIKSFVRNRVSRRSQLYLKRLKAIKANTSGLLRRSE